MNYEAGGGRVEALRTNVVNCLKGVLVIMNADAITGRRAVDRQASYHADFSVGQSVWTIPM